VDVRFRAVDPVALARAFGGDLERRARLGADLDHHAVDAAGEPRRGAAPAAALRAGGEPTSAEYLVLAEALARQAWRATHRRLEILAMRRRRAREAGPAASLPPSAPCP